MKTSFYLQNTDVCTRMELHGENLRQLLIENGWEQTSMNEADYIIFNTCAFIKKTEEEATIKLLELNEKLLELNNNKLIIIGCLPDVSASMEAIKPFKAYKAYDLDSIVNDFNLKKIPNIVGSKLNVEKKKSNYIVNFINIFLNNPYLTYLYNKKRCIIYGYQKVAEVNVPIALILPTE